MLILPGNSPRSSSENKAHQKVKGIAAVKKAPVVSYKKPPPIGGNDNLFDRFPIKKRKPLPAGVNVEQQSFRSEADSTRSKVDKDFVTNLKLIKDTVLYNVADIRMCLEELSEDNKIQQGE